MPTSRRDKLQSASEKTAENCARLERDLKCVIDICKEGTVSPISLPPATVCVLRVSKRV